MSRQPRVWTIVVAAGSGQRFGGPKHLERIGQQRVLDRSLVPALAVSDGVIVVVAPQLVAEIGPTLPADVTVVAGGATRSESVRAGISRLPQVGVDVVLVHDAARPLASRALFDEVIAAVHGGADAVVPGLALTDTIRHRATGTIDRTELVAVQTPQGFDPRVLRSAHRAGVEGTDDASLVEAVGGKVVVVHGEPANLKITHPLDLDMARAIDR